MVWRKGQSMARGPVNVWARGPMAQGPGLRRKGRPIERKTKGGNNVTASIVHMLPSNYSRLRTT